MTNVLYQHGTLGTLMAGLLEGTASINDLLEHGDLGIATLTGSDGEVIFVDGKAYHANEHKEFIELTGDEMTPYATVTKFKADSSFKTSNKNQEEVFDEVKKQMTSENMFSAVKISGTFKKMHVRIGDPIYIADQKLTKEEIANYDQVLIQKFDELDKEIDPNYVYELPVKK